MDPDQDPDRDPQTSISKRDRSYAFTEVFDGSCSNRFVYERLLPVPPKLLQGINCTIFAYGMTGAGKTHTMFGNETDQGLNFRLLEDLVATIKRTPGLTYSLKISYLEIYNEQIRDLLVPNSPNLLIYEDPIRGFLVSELSEYDVSGSEELRLLVNQGNQKRTMAATGANQFSSRSHAVLQVGLELTREEDKNSRTQSKLNLIDLAGSERASATDNRGLRMKESANINRSLMTLGLCINILSDSSKKGVFVPYRDSKLTKLLKDSLGGNTVTFMVACVSPFGGAYEETLNTLKYASKARNITKKVTRNIIEVDLNVVQYKKLVEELKKEIKDLRKELDGKKGESSKGSLNTLSNINTLGEDKKRERLFEEVGENIFRNLQEHWEIQQSVNELNELQSQNEERLKQLLQREAQGEDVSAEIKGLRLIMENNEKVKRGLEFSLMTNDSEKRSLQEYLRNFPKDERGTEREGESSQRMREMEMEMELMRRKLAEKDLLIEKNNKLLEILKRNHERSNNFSPQFYPLPQQIKGSFGFLPSAGIQHGIKKTISSFVEHKTSIINPIRIPEGRNEPQSNSKLSDRSHKKNPLIPQRFNNTNYDGNVSTSPQPKINMQNLTNDTSIMRVEEEKKEEASMSVNMNPISSHTISHSFNPNYFQTANPNTSGVFNLNRSNNSESPTKFSHQKINISLDNPMKLIPSKNDSPQRQKKPSYIENTAQSNNTNVISSSGNSNNNGLIINVILKGNSSNSNDQAPVRKKSHKELVVDYGPANENTMNSTKNTKESIKLNINKGCSSATNKYFKKMAVNVSYDSIQQQQMKKTEIPLMKANLTKQAVFNKNVPASAFINLKSPSTQQVAVVNVANNANNRDNPGKNNPLPAKSSKSNILSASMLKKDTRISVNIKNLDRARDNYKNFKEKLAKISQQNCSPEGLNDTLKKSIQSLLTDHAQNQYMLTQADQALVLKLKELINFSSGANITLKTLKQKRMENIEEKTRSNSVFVFDNREHSKEESKRNEEEILNLLNEKKVGRISGERFSSDHHNSNFFFQEPGS